MVQEQQIKELIEKWEGERKKMVSIADKSKGYGAMDAYKEFMSYSFGYAECIADLKQLIKE